MITESFLLESMEGGCLAFEVDPLDCAEVGVPEEATLMFHCSVRTMDGGSD